MYRNLTQNFWTKNLPCILFCLSLTLMGCGKKGDPRPSDSNQHFIIQSLKAVSVNGCLVFSGKITGAAENLDAIRLELDFLSESDNECLGCPFVPQEIAHFNNQEINLGENGEFSFTHCPLQAEGYRWRLIGVSKFTSLPHYTSAEYITFKQKTSPQ